MKCKSEINTIEHLKEENLIGVNNNVQDKNRLLIKITELADHAKVKYGILKKVPSNIVRGIVIHEHTFVNEIDEFNEASQRRESDDPLVNAPIQETTPFEMDESNLTTKEQQKLYRKKEENKI